jgi:hypothetical protein
MPSVISFFFFARYIVEKMNGNIWKTNHLGDVKNLVKLDIVAPTNIAPVSHASNIISL